MKHYYALSDWTLNRKTAIAFTSKKFRDDYVTERKLTEINCRALTRKEAEKLAGLINFTGNTSKWCIGLPIQYPDDLDHKYSLEFVIFRESSLPEEIK